MHRKTLLDVAARNRLTGNVKVSQHIVRFCRINCHRVYRQHWQRLSSVFGAPHVQSVRITYVGPRSSDGRLAIFWSMCASVQLCISTKTTYYCVSTGWMYTDIAYTMCNFMRLYSSADRIISRLVERISTIKVKVTVWTLAHYAYWRCPHRMRSRVYVTVGRPSVRLSPCPSVPPFCLRTPLPRVCCCGPGEQEISIDCCTAGAQQQSRRSKCGQCHVVSCRRKLNTDLLPACSQHKRFFNIICTCHVYMLGSG